VRRHRIRRPLRRRRSQRGQLLQFNRFILPTRLLHRLSQRCLFLNTLEYASTSYRAINGPWTRGTVALKRLELIYGV
jgi:hypothetical protein